jgi:hypothetical protein
MKYILLTFLIICIVVAISLKGKTLVINLVLPECLLPYYEWLITFPGLQPVPVTPSPEKLPLNKTNEL